MKFNSSKTAFGRHETFALRYGWLTKGYQEFLKNPRIFESDDAVVHLGVGKNMVNSIRYWLRACQILGNDQTPQVTEIGKFIFDPKTGRDRYLEDEATIWLIHWLLTTNAEMATSWFWFFNMFHKPEFTSQELTTALVDFARDKVKGKTPSLGTLKNDAQLLHRMYTQSKGNTRMPLEEALDSPLALLRLMTQSAGGRSYQSRAIARDGLPLGVLGFAITQLFELKETSTIPIEELMYSREEVAALGAVFRLTENDLVTKTEKLVAKYPQFFDIRESGGIHQLFRLKPISALQFLEDHYSESLNKAAA